jgi:hypothetical protein
VTTKVTTRSDTAACETCGSEFAPTRSNHLYCSAACRQRHYRLRRKVEKRAREVAEKTGMPLDEAWEMIAIGSGLSDGDIVILDERGRKIPRKLREPREPSSMVIFFGQASLHEQPEPES